MAAIKSFSQRRTARLCALLTALALLSVPALAQQVTITHMTYGSHAKEWHQFLQLMAERFEAETGIRVEVEVGPGGGEYREQVIVRTIGGMPPDVMDFNPGQAAILIREGAFADLRPFIEKSNLDLDEYPPIGLQGMTLPDGFVWGFPMSLLPIPVYFNVDMFAEAVLANPIELGEAWDWDAYLQSARRLTLRDGEGNVYQAGSTDWRYRYEQPVHQAGGMLFDRFVFPTKSLFNTPEVLEAYSFRATMKQEGLFATSGGVWNGNVALTNIDGPTIINRWVGGFRMDVALQPKGPAGKRSSELNPDGFQIHAQSPNKEAAWQWIEFLVGNPEVQFEFAAMTGRLPALREAMLRYGDIPRELPQNWYALIETAFSPDAFPPYMIDDASLVDALNKGHAPIWNLEVAPEVGLLQLHEQLQGILNALQ